MGTVNANGSETPSRSPLPALSTSAGRVSWCGGCLSATPSDARVADASGPSSRPRKMRRWVAAGTPVGSTRSCLSSPTVAYFCWEVWRGGRLSEKK